MGTTGQVAGFSIALLPLYRATAQTGPMEGRASLCARVPAPPEERLLLTPQARPALAASLPSPDCLPAAFEVRLQSSRAVVSAHAGGGTRHAAGGEEKRKRPHPYRDDVGAMAFSSFLEVAVGTRKIELTLNEIDHLVRSGPREMAAMGITVPFDPRNHWHLVALRQAAVRAEEQESERTSVRVQL